MQERVLSALQNICGQVQIFNHFDLLHLNERIMNLKETLIILQSGAHEDSENYFNGSFLENKAFFLRTVHLIQPFQKTATYLS